MCRRRISSRARLYRRAALEQSLGNLCRGLCRRDARHTSDPFGIFSVQKHTKIDQLSAGAEQAALRYRAGAGCVATGARLRRLRKPAVDTSKRPADADRIKDKPTTSFAFHSRIDALLLFLFRFDDRV